jgi:ParB/RepB/Spo0J family partition protein
MTRLKLKDIEPNPKQPRKDFDEEKLKELAENIKQVGLKQALIVRPLPTGGKYQLVDGERRYRACKLIPLEEVPVEIREDIKTEEDAAIQSYIMNEQRLNYNPQDKEAYIHHLYETTKLSTRKLAAKLGVHHSHVDHLLDAHRFRQKVIEEQLLPPTQVGTLLLTLSSLKQTAGIKDTNLRIFMIKAIHDKRIKADSSEITRAADILSQVPEEAREAYFQKLMTLEEIEFYLIKNPEYNKKHHEKLDELDKKLAEGKITKEEYDKHPIHTEIPVLLPMIKSSEILEPEVQERFITSADLIKEERTGIVYIQDDKGVTTHKYVFDIEKERRDPKYKEWYAKGQELLEKYSKWGRFYAEACAEWGIACEHGVIQATEDIEDLGLRIRTIQLVIDYRFAKWVDEAFKRGEEWDEEMEYEKEKWKNEIWWEKINKNAKQR